MSRKKNWSKNIEEAGLRARLYERTNGASIYFSLRLDGKKVQRSTNRSDRKEAEAWTRDVLRKIAEDRLLGRTGRPLTVGEAFTLWAKHKAPGLSEDWAQYGHTRRQLFEEAWGAGLPVQDLSQHHVDSYGRARMAGELSPFEESDHGRDPVEVRAGTVDGDFRWLSSVFNFLRKHRVGGRRVLVENPLHALEWPKEKNVRRPVASHDRFVRTMAKAGDVDPEGRLACMLALARWTGRREGAIAELRANDFLRTQGAVRDALAAQGMDESVADHFPHGGIRWRPESDKMGFATITPLSERSREALDTYLQKSPRVGDAWLFPAPTDDEKPIRYKLASDWLVRAEELAELPKLAGGRWHPYRRLWASERKHLPDVDVAAAGGWKDTRALKLSYQHADPATVLRVVEAGTS